MAKKSVTLKPLHTKNHNYYYGKQEKLEEENQWYLL